MSDEVTVPVEIDDNGEVVPIIAVSEDKQSVNEESAPIEEQHEPVVAEMEDEQQPVIEESAPIDPQLEQTSMSVEDSASVEVDNGEEMPSVAPAEDVQPESEEPAVVETQPVVEAQPEQTTDQPAMSAENKPTVELFVKAAPVDKEDKGPCPISQQWFMAFYILVEKGLINLRVTPINLDQPPLPANYTSLEVGRRLPVAWVESGVSPHSGEDISGIVADTNDAIENLIDLWQCPNLAQAKNNPAQRDAEKAGEDLYKHFNLMLKDGSSKPLGTDLRKLDDYLGQNDHRYMLGNELCYADCMLMPKLQHIRVAGKVYKDFEIDFSLKNVWLYIESMYATQAFYLSCPADCDILFHYMDKAKYPEGRKRPTLMSIEEKLSAVPAEVNSNRYEPINLKAKDPTGNGEN